LERFLVGFPMGRRPCQYLLLVPYGELVSTIDFGGPSCPGFSVCLSQYVSVFRRCHALAYACWFNFAKFPSLSIAIHLQEPGNQIR
jgi:hypothetical protein